MSDSDDVFKPPTMPTSLITSTSHVAFKMPQARKLSESSQTIVNSSSAAVENLEAAGQSKLNSTVLVDADKKEKNELKKDLGLAKPKIPLIESTYKPPVWGGPCTNGPYDLDILKDGRIVGNITLDTSDKDNKSYFIFGKQGDVIVDHPSISRHHAVVQYRALGRPHELGWYIYDMDSTNGTLLNKEKIPPFMHTPIRVGHMFKLGFSTRMYILNGPDEDREPESNLSVTEIKERADKQKILMLKRPDPVPIKEESEKNMEPSDEDSETASAPEPIVDSGISWGLSDDYGETEEKQKDEDEDVGESAMESIEDLQKREQLYIDDPKKVLKNFFDRQNGPDELQFEFTEKGVGARHQWTCRIELPIEAGNGRPVFAEATISGGKKEATIACALEACRILDQAGILRKSNQDGKKRKSKEWAENDYYDSDEDTFLDRTGEVERKRAKRIRQAAEFETSTGKSETYDTLSEKLQNVNTEIERVQQQIDLIKAEAAQEDDQSTEPVTTSSNRDSLDAYMATMSRRDVQEAKVRQSRLRLKLIELKKSADRLEKLVKIAKPTFMPPITIKTIGDPTSKKQPILIGSMKGHRMRKLVTASEIEHEEKIEIPQQVGCKEEDVVEVEEEMTMEKKLESKLEKIKFDTSTKVSTADVAPLDDEPPKNVDEQEEKMETEEKPTKQTKTRPTRQRLNKNKGKSAANDQESFEEYDSTDVNFAVWLPPDNQSGDGRTSLNEKFGY